MDRARTRKHTLRIVPTLAHIQAYYRRFRSIEGETFRELSVALAAIRCDRRYAVNTFREAFGKAVSRKLYDAQRISALFKHLQHSQIDVSEYYVAKQRT